jgi:hypothetical protein
MADAFNMLYRLFAPLFVVILIIAGVDLSSGLIKNAQEKQTAISVTYASSCPVGSVLSPSCTPAGPPSKGGKDGLPCNVAVPKAGTIAATCLAGCCKAGGWPDSTGKPATAANSSNPLAKALGGQTLSKALSGIMEKLMGGGGGGGGGDNNTPTQADYSKPPICKSLTVTPSVPLIPGEGATLSWTLEGGRPDAVVVSPGVGLVQGLSVKVSPSVSTTYTVAARNGDGTSTCPKVRVYVGPRNIGDEDTFSTDNTNPQYNTDVDIWGDTTYADPVVSGDSTYDNVSDVTITNNSENTNDNYYDFLSSLAADIQATPDTAGGYYYGDETESDWEIIEYEPISDISTDIIPEPQIDIGLSDDVYGDDYYNEYQGQIENDNGLTEEEIYGIWNRPQSPATGGLGLSGGLSSSANNTPTIDLSPDEEVGILSKVVGWVKRTFCVWCSDNTSVELYGGEQVAASFSPLVMEVGKDEQGEDNVKNIIGEITQPTRAARTEAVGISCTDEKGTLMDFATGGIGVNMVIAGVDVMTKPFTRNTGFEREFRFNKFERIYVGAENCRRKGNQIGVDILFRAIVEEGAANTVQKTMVCPVDDRTLTIMDTSALGGKAGLPQGAKYVSLPGDTKLTHLSTSQVLESPRELVVFCGNIQTRSSQGSIEHYSDQFCAKNPKACPGWSPNDDTSQDDSITERKACKTAFNSVGTLDSRGTCIPTAQKPPTITKEQVAEQERLRRQQAQITQQKEGLAKQKQQQQQAALKKAQQAMQKKAAAQKSSQKKQPQQRPPAPRPSQQPSPQDKSWLQQLLAKLKGQEQPQCASLTASKTKIRKGEEITLKWVVSGASKIVVTPKVELVTGDGKRYAKAKPESSVKYTLIATNDKGQEHRCQSQKIIVVEDTEQALACKGKVGTVTMDIEPDEIIREACAAGQTEEECDDAWEGKETAIKWNTSCMAQCTLTGPDGLEKDDIDTSKDSDELVGMLRKTSTFKMTCEDWEGVSKEGEVTATVTQE